MFRKRCPSAAGAFVIAADPPNETAVLEAPMTNTRSASTGSATQLRWVLGLTSTAYFMVVLDALVVTTALPRMQRDLHANLASLQWTVNSYGIAFAAGIISAAALGDRFGRRRVFNLGLTLFTLASAACALAPNAADLVVARTAQGLGAAAILPLSLTILTTAFPAQRRGRVVGIYGGLAALAVAAGPLLGGIITEALDWHWIFWLNVPIGLLATALATRLLPETHGAPERLDLLGVTLVTAGVVALAWPWYRPTTTAGPARRSSPSFCAAAGCWRRSSGGSDARGRRWCRCGCSKAGRSPSAMSPCSSCRGPPSPPRS